MKVRVLIILIAAVGFVLVGADVAATTNGGATLRVSSGVITYGQTIRLQGKLRGARRGERATVVAQPCPFTAPFPIATVRAGTGAAVRYALAPAMNTTYRLDWRRGKTRTVTVLVSPQVAIKKFGTGYIVDVSSGGGSSFAGKQIELQRETGSTWTTFALSPLKLTSDPTALTAVSATTYDGPGAKGSQVRAVLSQDEAGACYHAAASPAIAG